MSIKQFRPVTAGTRFRMVSGFDEITRGTPEKSLLEPSKKSGGRNNKGHVTLRRRGGGHKQQYRRIDFKRDKFGIPARVAEIEYDPNRTSRIALLVYADGEKRYIIHPEGLKQGDMVVSGPGSDVRLGNAIPLGEMPLGTTVHNVELKIGKGGQMIRSAGASAEVVAKEGDYVTLRMRSSEMRKVHARCMARPAPEGPRRRDEPGRPPAGWRRRQDLWWPSAGEPVGQAGRHQDPEAEEGLHQAHRARP